LATVTWVSDSDGFWDEGANWSNLVGPANGDEVVINRPTQVTVTYRGLGASAIEGLLNAETLVVSSGNLNYLGGAVRGDGTLRVDSGATFNFAGPDTTLLRGQTIRNSGTIVWSGGDLVQANGSNLIVNELPGVFDIQSDADVSRLDASSSRVVSKSRFSCQQVRSLSPPAWLRPLWACWRSTRRTPSLEISPARPGWSADRFDLEREQASRRAC
jgi:hypothetical protein